MRELIFFVTVLAVSAFAQQPAAAPTIHSLPQVRRIYVAELSGDAAATLRDLIITGIDGTKHFIITDNLDRADAVLRGSADDHAFDETLDIQEGISARQGGGASSSSYKTGGSYGSLGVSDSEFRHSKERKHEAYASVRLVNRDGDVLWSTTQESGGAKFRGAGADVAAKVAHQLTLDYDHARHAPVTPDTGVNGR